MSTGIDKLWLNTYDFAVKDAFSGNFGIDQRIKQGNKTGELPYLLTDRQGKEVRAHKIHHNPSKDFPGAVNFTIDRTRGTQRVGLMVQFNPSKIIHPYQLVQLGSGDYKNAINQVEQKMESLGIQANFNQMSINRIDIAKQHQMEYPFDTYEDALKLMKCSRSKRKSMEGQYSFYNNQAQTTFYDKIQELRDSKQDNSLSGEKNLMRNEIRALHNPSVSRIFGIGTISHLNEVDNDYLETCYKNYLNSRIFGNDAKGTQLKLEFDTEVQIMRHFLQATRDGWKNYLLIDGLDISLNKLGGMDKWGELLSEAGMDRSLVFRTKAKTEQMLKDKAKMDRLRNKVTSATLISELKDKFAA